MTAETKTVRMPNTSRMTARHEWIEIQTILDEYKSGDFDTDGYGWESGLNMKRDDSHYSSLLKDIEENGLKTPICIETWRGRTIVANGHHRLAALIDLGYTHVPYCDSFTISCGYGEDF